MDDLRLSVFTQGANWNQASEVVRVGKLDGWQGAGQTGYGLAMGDYASRQYIRFTTSDMQFYSSGTFSAANGVAVLGTTGLIMQLFGGLYCEYPQGTT